LNDSLFVQGNISSAHLSEFNITLPFKNVAYKRIKDVMELHDMRNMAEVNCICCYRTEKERNGSPLVLLHKKSISHNNKKPMN
jgi:hypothetical protein